MFQEASLLFLRAVTSLHPGSGSEVKFVDLPVQRERFTAFPKIEGSSFKGAVRAAVESSLCCRGAEDLKIVERIFGAAAGGKEKSGHAGALAFTDARLLLFPVRSLKGTFVWLTCPYVLKRWQWEIETFSSFSSSLGAFRIPVPQPTTVSGDGALIGGSGQKQPSQNGRTRLALAEFAFDAGISEECERLAKMLGGILFSPEEEALKSEFVKRVAVLEDDVFVNFVTLFTEVNARIRISARTGTADADASALWYEENVPPETVFYSFCLAGEERVSDGRSGSESREKQGAARRLSASEVMAFIKDEGNLPPVFTLGGSKTTGSGVVRRIWV